MAQQRTKWELVHQFVHEVVDFSSQYGSESGTGFTAANIVGPCQVYPNYCDSNATCSFRTYGKWWRNSPSYLKPINLTHDDNTYSSEDYVDLYFDIPVIPIRLQIYETYNPGAIVRISAGYRHQPANNPVNTRKIQWTTLWKLNSSNHDNKHSIVPFQHTNQNNSHYHTRQHQPHNQHQQRQQPLQLTYQSNNNTCTTLACLNPYINVVGAPQQQGIPDVQQVKQCLPSAISYHDENEFTTTAQYLEYLPQSRIFQPTLSNIQPCPTDLIRIEFDNTRCQYYTQIDAVRLSGWAELTDTMISRSFGQLEAPTSLSLWSSSSSSSSPSSMHIVNSMNIMEQQTNASFFSDLLKPCTPRLRASSYDLTNEPMDISSSMDSLSNPLIDANLDEDDHCSSQQPASPPTPQPPPTSSSSSSSLALALLPLCLRRKSSGLIQIPPVGMNLLLLQSRNLIALPPGTICQSSLVGWNYLNENALWRHGPLTRLPYEVLLHIFSYLDLRSLFRCARVSRQFRCLVQDTLANVTSINLQSFWSTLNNATLISLGKRLGQVNLTAKVVAEYYTTGQSLVAPITLLRRQVREEEQEGEEQEKQERGRQNQAQMTHHNDLENRYVVTTDKQQQQQQQPNLTKRRFTKKTPQLHHTSFAARVRSYSSNAAARLLSHAKLLNNSNSSNNEDFHQVENEYNVNQNFNDSICIEDTIQSDEFQQNGYFDLPDSHLRRLDMSWCGNYSQITPTSFGHFLSDACRYLITLRLSSCKFLNDDCLLHIVNTCPYLEELDLSSCTGVTPYGFSTLGRLIHLHWISLYRTHINDNCLLILAELCQHLKHVNLGSCIDVSDMNTVLEELTRNNRNLRSLNLWRCNSLTATGLSFITENCLQLEELDIGWCRNVVRTQESNCIVQLASRVKYLKKLFLTGTNLLNSEELLLVSQHLHSTLEQFDIHGSTSITIAAIVTLLNQCKQLKLLDISFCPEIHSINLMKLRYLFPFCTIIDSIPDMNAELLGNNQYPEMIIDEVDDDDDGEDDIDVDDAGDNDDDGAGDHIINDGGMNAGDLFQFPRRPLALPAPDP
ncbi:unnamed protein product [Schistosoma turkestanicum]|nr:unnamed protein product [Schistosoma turkestanicum]CAH8599884.1 unnamed protein product [Schistosoma turkestanicum]